jgi:hypothetical protein
MNHKEKSMSDSFQTFLAFSIHYEAHDKKTQKRTARSIQKEYANALQNESVAVANNHSCMAKGLKKNLEALTIPTKSNASTCQNNLQKYNNEHAEDQLLMI